MALVSGFLRQKCTWTPRSTEFDPFGQPVAPDQAQTVNQELGIDAPAAASGPSIAERLGVDEKAAVESTGEVMISREAYEKLAAEDESFARATESKVRYGAMGRTFDENAAAIRASEADPLNAPDDPWAKEARDIRDEKAQELKDSGFDDASAEAMAYVYAKNRFVKAVTLGTDFLGIRKNDARSPKQLRQIELDNRRNEAERADAASTLNQALRAGVNLEERVPVIDISAAMPQAKGMDLKGLVAQLKGMMGQETSISRDALGFLSLPTKSMKIRHVAHSGAPVLGNMLAIRNASVLSLPELMKNAVLVESGANTKQGKKPDVLNYHRFYVPVMLNGKVSVVRIVAEEKKTSDGLTPVDVNVYDVVIDKKSSLPPMGTKPHVIKAENSLYEITIGDMLKNVKGMDGKFYEDALKARSYALNQSLLYDGLILDEGGDGGYGETVEKRGLSWVQRSSNQIKSVNNQGSFDGTQSNIFFQSAPSSSYEARLDADVKAWEKTVDALANGKLRDGKHFVMSMPLVLTLTGAKLNSRSEPRRIITTRNVLNKILLGKHSQEMTVGILKQLPRAMADPVMVFKSDTRSGDSVVVMLELKDKNGSTVVAPVLLTSDPNNPDAPAVMTSLYGKGTPKPNNQWFIDQINRGNLLYIDTKKSTTWAASGGLQLPGAATVGAAYGQSIQTEADLVKARKDKANEFYQTKNSTAGRFSEQDSQHEEKRGQIAFMSDGTAVVSLFEKADRSTFFHEMGHFMLEELIQYGLDEAATEDMKRDLAVAVDYLGIGFLDLSQRTSFSPAKADRYRKAQEDFARSFEAYLMTGRAPSVEMKGIFSKLRRWLLDIYADMTRLEVKLSPEVHDLFDRLLATPEEIDAARADFATVADLAKENEAAASRLKELDGGMSIPRVLSAMWDSAALDDKDMPAWATPELINGISDAMQLGRPELVKAVRKLGGIDYDSLVAVWGWEEAERLRTRDKSLFRKKGAKFDTLVSKLAHEGIQFEDAQALWNRLMADDPAVDNELKVSIDDESLPWLFYLMSDDEVLRYAKRRGTELNRELKKLQSADDSAGLRLKGPAIQEELNLIAEIKAELKEARASRPSPDSDAGFSGDAKFSADIFVHEGTVERQSVPTQAAADKAAGVTRDDGGSVPISEADRVAWKRAERVSRQSYRLAYKEGMRVQRDKAAALKAAQRLRAAQKSEINGILKGVKKAAADKKLSWSMKLKISERLKGYTLKKPSRERLAMAEELKAYLEQTPEAELSNFSASDQRYIKMLETTTLWDMTIADVRRLGSEIGKMQQQGREEYDRWQMERDARREAGWRALMDCTGTGAAMDGDDVSTVITAADLKKPYTGISGRLEKVKDWAYANTLGANRFFDWLGGGHKDYKSAWTRYFVDAVNAALDDELRWRQERFEAMEARMMELNLSPKRLNEIRYVDGQAYPVDALIHVYAGLKNERSRKAILYGNMGARFRKHGEAAVEAHAARCVQALTPAERALGDAVIADFATSFDRLNEAYIAAFNEGMTPEENYTPMRRLEYTALDLAGLRADATEAELIEGQAVESGARNAVLQKGFLNDRLDISEENQKPVHLGLLGLWRDQVTAQEHTAAYGRLAGDLRSMLMKRDDSGNTLGKLLKLRFGSEALGYLREYTNIAIEGQAVKAAAVMDDISGYLGKNMAVAYLALNLGTVLKQFSSLPRFLITAGPGHIFSALGEFMKGVNPKGTNKLLSEVYALDTQMKNRSSDTFVQVMKDARKYGKTQSAFMDMLELMMEPISYMDRVVSCIGWKATYESNIKRGLSKADAAKEAQRAVALTQQTPLAKDMPRIWNQKGLARLFMLFTSDAANTWGMTVYDLAHGKGNEKLQTVAALAMTAVMMGYMQGGPDDDDAWIAWYMKQLAAQQVGAVPMAGKEFMSAIEALSRGGGDTTYSAISTPFIKLVMGLYSAFGTDDAGKTYPDGSTKRERGLFMALEGASLLTTFPFTLVNRIRRMARSEDAADAARVMFGMRRAVRRAQRGRY